MPDSSEISSNKLGRVEHVVRWTKLAEIIDPVAQWWFFFCVKFLWHYPPYENSIEIGDFSQRWWIHWEDSQSKNVFYKVWKSVMQLYLVGGLEMFGTSILFSQKYWEFHHPN